MDLGNTAKGGKRPLDAAINLVPFIDLMAVMISFLIMTAVWNQAGRLQVSQAGGGGAESTAKEPDLSVTLQVSTERLSLTIGGSVLEPIAVHRDLKGRLDVAKLQEQLRELKLSRPDHESITLQADDAVRYEDLVRIIDACLGGGLPSVQVSTG